MNFHAPAVRERASSVCVANGKVLMVNLKDPVTGVERLFPPGGKIEAGETPVQTAVRETREETGFEVVPLEGAEPVVALHRFTWAGVSYDVRTHFIPCVLAEDFREPKRVQDASYNLGALWLPTSETSHALDFQIEIREAVLGCLEFF